MRLRGLEEQHELSPQLLLRDTRTLGMKIVDFFKSPVNSAILMMSFAMGAFFFSPVCDLIGVIGILIFLYAYTRRSVLPFRMPQRSLVYDYNDFFPGTTKPRKARGITFFGNRRSDNDEIWFNNDDMRTHVLMFGSTGSGKTVALTSLAFNALVQGSGFLYIDGKGDNTLFANMFAMCRSMGREDDLLLINFMTGARDVVGPQEKRLSNTMNPFCSGSSSMLSQLVVSLMDAGTQSADGDMWKGRAIVFVEALMKVLVYMRDKGKLLLDANAVRNYFELPRLEAIAVDKVFPRDNQEPVSLADAPDLILEPIKNYIKNLPGYDAGKKGKQVSQVLEQHGFITMQLTRVFGSLADTYGHIIRTNLAEVDLKDVVLNRRILIVLLPALEKSTDELAALGKVIIASLKAMMAAGLGESVEGSYRDVIMRKPTNAPTPYMCILDEYGYYAVKGFAVVPAQARSLGFSVVFAGQDLPAFQKASKEEAASIGANTNIKICMKLEDPLETWDFFHKTAGESWVTKVDSFQTNAGTLLNNYMDSRSASSEKRQRIDLLDLKNQQEGEAHIFFKAKIVRARMFYVKLDPAQKMRLNHFLKVEPPLTRVVFDLEQRMEKFDALVKEDIVFNFTGDETDEITYIADALQTAQGENAIERCLNALLAFHGRNEVVAGEEVAAVTGEAADDFVRMGEMNIFSRVFLSDTVMATLTEAEKKSFSLALLNKTLVKDKIELIERILGRSVSQASGMTQEIIKDMGTSTEYPPHMESFLLTPMEVIAMANEICSYFVALQSRSS
ncbi:MAG TPA: TraM recognition domain-containing protein [Gammaproteobacteria bacterium]|jgi:intracellular multiplication protein IcmO|nr:TraM recognition domain-containing protein [Gammaproteobacteria bacterium]